MFGDLSGHQLTQLEKVWKAALNATSWRGSLRYEMSRALATGCTQARRRRHRVRLRNRRTAAT
jgi:hypothetical protein